MKIKTSIGLLVFGLVQLASTDVMAAGINAGLIGGPSFTTASMNNTSPATGQTNSRSSGFGLGMMMGAFGEYKHESNLGAEVDFLWARRSWKNNFTLTNVGGGIITKVEATSSYSYLMFPLVLRYWLMDTLSLGVGGYFGFGAGDVTTEGNFVSGQSGAFKTTAVSESDMKTDMGFLLSVAYAYNLVDNFSIRGDARFMYGLDSNKDSIGAETSFRDIQLLIGAQFSF